MSQYQFSDLNTTVNAIPPKTRTVRKSPLAARMEKLKINEAFVVNDAQMASVAANIYATAKRLGVKVSLRQLPEGVGVWRVRNTNASQTDLERKQDGNSVPARKRTSGQNQGRGRGRKAA